MTDSQDDRLLAGTFSRRGFLVGPAAAFTMSAFALTRAGGAPAALTLPRRLAAKTLSVGIAADISPPNFLGVLASNAPIGRLIFEPLLDWDAATGKHVPWLAKSWTWAKDRKSLTVDLRNDVVFHNGKKFTADDVRASVQAALVPGSGAQVAASLKNVDVKAVSPTRVLFSFPGPTGDYFLDAMVWMRIVPNGTSVPDLAKGQGVVGTGPFAWSQWVPGSSVTLNKHSKYWQKGHPGVDTVTLRVITQSQAMLLAMRSGQIDIAHRMVPRDVKALASDKSVKVSLFNPFSEVYLGVDVSIEPFNDIRVRRAIAWSLDRQRIVNQVFAGYAQPTDFPFPPTAPGLAKLQKEEYGYNIAKAKALMAQAGAAGAKVSLGTLANDPILNPVRDIIQFNLTQIGFNVTAVDWDSAQFPLMLGGGKTGGLYVSQVASGSLSPGSMTSTLLPYRPGANASNIKDPRWTSLVSAAKAGTAKVNKPLAQYALDQAFHLTVARILSAEVSRTRVKGAKLDSNGYLDLSSVQVV